MEEESNQQLEGEEKRPNKPNFSLMAKMVNTKEGIVSIYLEKRNGKTFPLDSFLAEGFCFKFGQRHLGVDSVTKQVIIPQDLRELTAGGRRPELDFLHELGHTHQKVPKVELHKGEVLIILLRALKRALIGKKLPVGHSAGFEELLPIWPESAIKKGAPLLARIERDAWAFALRAGRQLEREGFNVFAGFDNVRQIQQYIYDSLYTYESAIARNKSPRAPAPSPIFVRPKKW